MTRESLALGLLTISVACGTAESASGGGSGGAAAQGSSASGGSANAGRAGSSGQGSGGSAAASSGAGASAGGSGNDVPRFVHYIRSTPFSRLILEVDSVAGFEPRPEVEARLAQRLEQILDKPSGVEVVRDDTLTAVGAEHSWTDAELDELARGNFDGDPSSSTIAIHLMFVDGHSARDGDSGVILGLAWNHLYVAIFKETVESTCGGLALIGDLREQACSEAELGILTHEIGHVLGLVDNGLPMVEDHKDPSPEHGAHDVDPECIMYWAYEGQELVELIGARLLASQEESLGFCAPDLADIEAAK